MTNFTMDESDASSGSKSLGDNSTSTGKHSGSGTNATGDSSEDDNFQSIKDALTKSETRQVFRLRVIVIFILIAAGASISMTVYLITSNAEREEFDNEYYGVADKIIEAFQDVMVEISAVSGLAVAASAESNETSLEWPFLTLSNFQERARNAKTLSGAIYVSINPVVTSDNLDEWENYVRGPANQWM